MKFIKVEDLTPMPVWEQQLTERNQMQVEFSRLYAEHFHHGADGHNSMMIIAQMAKELDHLEMQMDVASGSNIIARIGQAMDTLGSIDRGLGLGAKTEEAENADPTPDLEP